MRLFLYALGVLFLAAGSVPASEPPETPIITPAGGSFKPPIEVGINSFNTGTSIHFTLDGSVPISSSPVLPSGALLTLNSSKIVRAIALDESGLASGVATASFSLTGVQTTAKPVITPGDANSVGPIIVTIATSTPHAALYYTTDGSNPSPASKRYRAPFAVSGSPMMVRAIAVGGGRPASPIAQAVYRTGLAEQVRPPAITSGSVRFDGWTTASIASPTQGAIVRYTTDGSLPGLRSPMYSGPKTICVTTTLKARAFKAGMADSPVATARFEADATPPTALDVSNYGALPASLDNTQAVQSALNNACNALEGSNAARRIKIVFPTGVYHFLHGLSLNHANNVDIDGQGSTFVFHNGGYTGLTIGEHGACANITVQNILVDSDPLPDIPGTVTNSTGATFDFVVDPGYEATARRFGAILEFDPASRHPKARGVDICYGAGLFPTVVDARTLHFSLPYGKVADGMYLNLRRAGAGHTFVIANIDGVVFRNIRLYSGYGFALVPVNCENIRIDRFVVMRKPGRAALSSNEADDLHFHCCKGPIEIKDCDFEYQGDDCINLAGSYFLVTAVDGNKITITKPGIPSRSPAMAVGETIELVDGRTMLQRATALVTAVSSAPKNDSTPATTTLTLDSAPANISAGTDLVESLTWLASANVERCNFIGNRARGILIQYPDTLVQDCSFIDVSGSGVHVSTVAKIWYEGSGTTDVVVRDNSFRNCDYLWKLPDGAIHVYAENQFEQTGAAGTHARLAVVDNTIVDNDHAALSLSAVDDVDVIGNVFDNCVRDPIDKTDRANSVVWTNNALRVRLHDNTMSHGAANVINVRDLGARGDAVTDDTAAINAAIAAGIKKGPGAEVFVPAGEYLLSSHVGGAFVHIDKADGLTFRGEKGSDLLFGDPRPQGISLTSSSNTTIKDLTIEQDKYYFTQGTCVAQDPAALTVDLQLDPGYPQLDAPQLWSGEKWSNWSVHIVDKDRPGCYEGPPYFTGVPISLARIADRLWRLKYGSFQGWPAVPGGMKFLGKKMLIWDMRQWGRAIYGAEDKDCLIDNVRYYGKGANGGYSLCDCSGVMTFRRYVIDAPPGSEGLLSCGGGGQCSDIRGTLVFDHCDIQRVDDDGADIFTMYKRVHAQRDGRTIVVQTGGRFHIGDTIAIVDWISKEETTTAKVLGANTEPGGDSILSLDRDVTIARAGVGDDKDARTRDADGIDRVVDYDCACTNVVFDHCRIQCNRSRPLNLKCQNCLVENCEFTGCHAQAIFAGPETLWAEAPCVHNLIIRNNKFIGGELPCIDIGVHIGDDNAGIGVGVYGQNETKCLSLDNRNVIIEGNRFDKFSKKGAIWLRNASHVVIRNNHFGAPAGPLLANSKIVNISQCQDVAISGNSGL